MYLDNFPDLCFKTKVWKNPFWARLKAWIIGAICELFIYVLGFCLKLRFKDIVWMGYFVIQHVFLPFKVGKTRLIPRSKLITPERNIMSTTKIRKRGGISFWGSPFKKWNWKRRKTNKIQRSKVFVILYSK